MPRSQASQKEIYELWWEYLKLSKDYEKAAQGINADEEKDERVIPNEARDIHAVGASGKSPSAGS